MAKILKKIQLFLCLSCVVNDTYGPNLCVPNWYGEETWKKPTHLKNWGDREPSSNTLEFSLSIFTELVEFSDKNNIFF